MKTFVYHVQINVGDAEREDVDRFVEEFLKPRGIYYGAFFEDPDRLKLEVVYVPGIPDRSTPRR